MASEQLKVTITAVDKMSPTLKNISNNTSKMSSTFKKIGAIVATAFATDKIISFGKTMIQNSADVSASWSAFNSTLGKGSDKMVEKLKTLGNETGITYTRMLDQSTLYYGKWLQNTGDANKAMDMTIESLKLGADASAYYNLSLDESNERIKSFINGNLEAGDAIGISTSAAGIAAWAQEELGINYTKCSEAQKQAIRKDYIEHMYNVAGVSGQAARESGEFQNSVANLKEAWKQFTAVLGEDVLNGIVVPAIQNLTDWITNTLIPGVENAKAKFDEFKNKCQEIGEKFTDTKDKAKEMLDAMKDNGTLQALTVGFLGLGAAILIYNGAAIMACISSMMETAAIVGLYIAEGVCTGATMLLTAATTALGAVFAFLTSPITLAILAITALIAIGILLYKNWDTVKAKCIEVWEAIKKAVTEGAKEAWLAVKTEFELMWTFIKGVFLKIKSVVTEAWNNIKTTVSNAANNVKTTVSNVWNSVKSATTSVWNSIKSAVSSAVNGVKSTVTSTFNSVKSTVTSIWNSIKSAITGPINAAKSAVSSAMSAIKSAVNVHLKPKLTLPHISVSGKLSLNPPSVPKISVAWYRKGGIMTDPTVFGFSGSTAMVGGEAGPEGIIPLNPFYDYLDKKFDSNSNAQVVAELIRLRQLVSEKEMVLDIDGREFMRTVAKYQNEFDNYRSTRNTRLAY